MIVTHELVELFVARRAGTILLALSLPVGVSTSSPAIASCADMSAPMRLLAGCNASPGVAFTRPPVNSAIFAGPSARDEEAYAAYLKTVEGMLTTKARALARQRYFGKVAVCFNIGPDGRVSNRDLCHKSGNPDADRFVLAVVASLGPLPAPPPSSSTTSKVVWVYSCQDEPAARTSRDQPHRSRP